MISIKNVCKKIGTIYILKDINIEFKENKIYGLQGKNGSGKTMLLRAISGLMKPTSGEIYIGEEKLYEDISFPRSVGVLIENPAFLSGLTGYDNLELIASLITDNKENKNQIINEALEGVGLFASDKRKYRKYSLGMKQRLGVAAAVLGEPDIIVLDEPINALDPQGIEMVRSLLLELKKKGKIIIVACHDREELEYLADEIYTMQAGQIHMS